MGHVRIGLALALLAAGAVRAADPPVDFARDVRPILSHHCWTCHGPDEKARQAGLRLDLRGRGDRPRKRSSRTTRRRASSSRRITDPDEDRVMPPPESKRPLTDRQKQILKAWVEQGATYPSTGRSPPPKRPAVPTVPGVRNADRRVRPQRLEKEGLKPAAEADRADAHPPGHARPDRPAADAGRGRRLPRGHFARRLREGGRPPARLAAVRRADGDGLARRRPVRGHQRVQQRRGPRPSGRGATG